MQKIKGNYKVIIVFILAWIVRVLGIASRPIWYDEAFSILFSEKGYASMLYGTLTATIGGGTADIHPIGYYTMLWLWMKAFGESLVAVRMLSIIAGMGVVCLIYLIGRELFSKTTAMIAMLFASSIAPPSPWTMRKTMIWVSDWAMPHSAEPTVKTTKPRLYMRTRPKRSASRPKVSSATVLVRL